MPVKKTPLEDEARAEVTKHTAYVLRAARRATDPDNAWPSGFLRYKTCAFAFGALVTSVRDLGIAEQKLAEIQRVKRIAREA